MAVAYIPEIKLTLKDGTICDLRADMGRLMWDANHPRITGFLSRCARRYGAEHFTLQTAPAKVLNRLAILVNIYWQCYQCMTMLKINWDDNQLLEIFLQYGNSVNILLDGWIKVLTHLNKRWFESDIAF